MLVRQSKALLGRRLPPATSALWPRAAPLAPRRPLSTFPDDVVPAPPGLLARQPPPTGSAPEDDVNRRTAYVYLDAVYPIRIHMLDPRYILAQIDSEALLARLRALVPLDTALQTRVESIIPRQKDGGAWVQFSYILPQPPFTEFDAGSSRSPEEEAKMDEEVKRTIEKEVRDSVWERGSKEWWVSKKNDVFLVKGKPWREDMNRFVNRELRVEFEGPEIPQEDLYTLFRPYGRIHDIVPANPKDAPKFARIIYTSLRPSAAARNCLHGFVYPPTKTTLRILFTERVQGHYIKDWASSHPRITLPIIVALLGALSWAVFDPIREFFIKNKIEGTWDSNRWQLLSWLKRETLGRLGLGANHGLVPSTGIEREREEAKEQLGTWLRDIPDTFIMVTGPRGSGKTALVDDVTKSYDNVLAIDCTQICKNARSETKLVSELASAVGYYPQFVLAASLNNLIDLASMGLIGQKAGFSNTLDAQLKQILEVTSAALKSLASERNARALAAAKHAEGLRAHAEEREEVLSQMDDIGIRDGRLDAVAGNGAMSELGGGIERPGAGKGVVILGPNSAHSVKAFLEPNRDCAADRVGGLPIVVIKGFASKGAPKQEVLWDVLAEWAAVLVENQVAHVIFASDSVTANKPLAKALPNKPFNAISLNDASPDSALQYIEAKLSEIETPLTLSASSKAYIQRLGGRQTDLELLVQKIKAGMAPEEAVGDIVDRSTTELRKNFFGDDDEEAKDFKWTRAQVWSLAKGLANKTELLYADVLVNSPFKSNDGALRALENAELISIHHVDGRPSMIRPGRPVYRSAFQQLLSDSVYAAGIEYQINAAATSSASADLNSASKQLIELSQLFGNGKWVFGGSSTVPKEIEVRVTGLLAAMRTAEEKLESLAKQQAELLKVLATEA